MSSTPREIGTLIVVILKANHLPNKRHIGKQDPYCLVSVNGEKRRTKAIKRGGQHPEWDEEIRFTLFEDVEDELERTSHGDGAPPPPPPKDDKAPKKIKGGKIMRLSCFADDPREPDLIGETDVDLTEVLTKGETDEWFTLMNKDKFSGKVYLELTFWSNEPPPEKKVTPKPPKSNKQYGGPGSFVPSGEIPSSLTTAHGSQSSRITSTSSLYEHSRRESDSVPSSLRTSNSLAKLDLYVPPYEQRNGISPIDRVTNDFGELGVSEHRRRESFPPLHGGYTPRPSSSIGFSTLPSYPSHGYEQSLLSDTASIYAYDRPLTPTSRSSLNHRSTISGPHPPYPIQPSYQPEYETGPPSGYHPSPTRGPRYSIPSSSSGFVPLSSASGFVPLSSHPSEPSGFAPPLSHTPTPILYNPSHFNPQLGFTPVPSQTPAPSNFTNPLPPSSSTSFHPNQSFPPSQSFQYSQYAPPPQQYMAPQPPLSVPPQPSSAPAPVYQGYPATPSPPHDNIPPPPPLNTSLSSSFGAGSRPLPQQPQVYGQQQAQPSYSLPPGNSQQHLGSYSPTQPGNMMFSGASTYQPVPPPPPPPPPIQSNTTPPAYAANGQPSQTGPAGPPPPPPPPPPQFQANSSSRRHSSLPQPPVTYQSQQQPVYQQVPPPPPPPDFTQHIQPPPPPPSHLTNQSQPYYPGPPPNPPVQQNDQGAWLSSHGAQHAQGSYVQQEWT